MPSPADNQATAIALARAGFAVFPCHSGGDKAKQPMPFLRWRDASTTAEHQILAWWRKWPEAAPALDLAKSGLIVIDADRHGADDGVEAFGRIMADNGFDPDSAPIVATPNSGNHHIFRQPPGQQLGNGRGMLPAGVDVRGHGGYVVAPGTVMQDGRVYELFGDLAAAPTLPDFLAAIIAAPRPVSAIALTPAATLPASSEIEELLSYIPADCGYHDWVAVLMAIHAATGGTGLGLADQWSARGGAKYPGSKEIEKKWRSFKRTGVTGRTLAQLAREHGADLAAIAIKYQHPQFDPVEAAAASRRLIEHHDGTLADADTGEIVDVAAPAIIDDTIGGATDYSDLPDSDMMLPGVVGEIANWVCQTTGEPIRVHALGAALVTVGTLLGRKVYSQTRPTGTHLYVGAVAPTGFGKDHPQTCIKALLDGVTGMNRALHIPWASSAPKLGLEVVEHPAVVMIADEFAEKLASTRNRNAGVSTAAINEVFKEMWGRSQSSYILPTAITRSKAMIHRPALSFYGAATIRDFKESLISKDVTSGLYNRFLFLPRFEDVPSAPEMDGLLDVPERTAARCRWLHDCLDQFQMPLAMRADGYPGAPILVPFTAEAEKMNEANRTYQKDMQRRSDDDAALALYGRYAEQIKRVAMIVACGRSPEFVSNAVITEDEMVFAGRLVKWSTEQAVLMVRRDMVENWMQGQHNLVLGIIRKARRIRRSDLYVKVKGAMRHRDLDELIKALIEAESIEERRIETGKKGRPVAEYVYLRG